MISTQSDLHAAQQQHIPSANELIRQVLMHFSSSVQVLTEYDNI